MDKENYRYLWEGADGHEALFKTEQIVGRIDGLTQKTIKVLYGLGLKYGKDVVINDALMENAVLDYFADIARVKNFHDEIVYASNRKILGYGMFWFVRRSPVQIIGSVKSKNLSINEIVATHIIIAELLEEGGVHKGSDNKDFKSIRSFSDKIRYSLTYRPFTQQTLELMLDAFVTGAKIKEKSL